MHIQSDLSVFRYLPVSITKECADNLGRTFVKHRGQQGLTGIGYKCG